MPTPPFAPGLPHGRLSRRGRANWGQVASQERTAVRREHQTAPSFAEKDPEAAPPPNALPPLHRPTPCRRCSAPARGLNRPIPRQVKVKSRSG